MDFNRANRKAMALLALVFVLGVALGAVGNMLVDRNVFASRDRGQGGEHRLVDRLTSDLNLTPDQQKQFSDILADTQSRYDVIRKQMDPLFDEARNQSRNRMRKVLTPDQQPKFEDFLRRVDEERRRRRNNSR
jgi:Spy/CpxP family protein refolding chaperone